MAKCNDAAHDQCFYCDQPLARWHEHDHYPIPKRHGGTHVEPVCINCHSLKDRQPLERWPLELFIQAHGAFVEALGYRATRTTAARILFAKMVGVMLDGKKAGVLTEVSVSDSDEDWFDPRLNVDDGMR